MEQAILYNALLETGLARTMRQADHLLLEGAVLVNGRVVRDGRRSVRRGDCLRVERRMVQLLGQHLPYVTRPFWARAAEERRSIGTPWRDRVLSAGAGD